MEADDVLTDDMEIRRPVMGVLLSTAVGMIPDAGDVVGQGVQPDVHHMIGIEIHRDSPFEGGAGNTEIGQSRLEEIVDHLVAAGIRLDEIRILLVILQQLVLVFG